MHAGRSHFGTEEIHSRCPNEFGLNVWTRRIIVDGASVSMQEFSDWDAMVTSQSIADNYDLNNLGELEELSSFDGIIIIPSRDPGKPE